MGWSDAYVIDVVLVFESHYHGSPRYHLQSGFYSTGYCSDMTIRTFGEIQWALILI